MASSRSRSSRGVRVGGSVRLFALFLLGVVFFSVMIEQAEGLKCYLCTSKSSRSAFQRSAFDKIQTKINSTKANKGRSGRSGKEPSFDCNDSQSEWYQSTCKSDETTCMKIERARGCDSGTLGCQGGTCHCNTDLCNGASSMSSIGGIFIFIISTMVASISASTTGGF